MALKPPAITDASAPGHVDLYPLTGWCRDLYLPTKKQCRDWYGNLLDQPAFLPAPPLLSIQPQGDQEITRLALGVLVPHTLEAE